MLTYQQKFHFAQQENENKALKISLSLLFLVPNIKNARNPSTVYFILDELEQSKKLYHAISHCVKCSSSHTSAPQRKVERQVKGFIKNLAIFFQCPSKQFLAISFQIRLMEYFLQKQKDQRHKQLGYPDKIVITEIQKLKNVRSTWQL